MKIDKASDKSTKINESYKIYTYMADLSSNVESPRTYFGDS